MSACIFLNNTIQHIDGWCRNKYYCMYSEILYQLFYCVYTQDILIQLHLCGGSGQITVLLMTNLYSRVTTIYLHIQSLSVILILLNKFHNITIVDWTTFQSHLLSTVIWILNINIMYNDDQYSSTVSNIFLLQSMLTIVS